jgi:NTE family protein
VAKGLSHGRERGFDAIAGASVGAINAAYLAQYQPDEFKAAADMLEVVWREDIQGRSSIWRWRFPPVLSALWSPSVGDSSPLFRILQRRIDPSAIMRSGVRLRIPTVDLATGCLVEFTEEARNLVAVVLASASIPGLFPPRYGDGCCLVDGGVRDFTPLGSLIDLGAERIWIALTRSLRIDTIPLEDLATVTEVLLRTLEVVTNEVLASDIRECCRVNEAVRRGEAKAGKRIIDLRVIVPSKPLASSSVWDPKILRSQLEQGIEDATRVEE